MIKNERQYGITKAEVGRFEKALTEFTSTHGVKPTDPIRNAQLEALESQLEDLREDVRAYETLKAGEANLGVERPLSDVSKALIEARIALGLTQRQLAERLEIQEQQIQRYEDTDYSSASLDRVLEIADALEPFQFTIQLQDARTQSVAPNAYSYNLQTMHVDPWLAQGGISFLVPYGRTNFDLGHEVVHCHCGVFPTSLVGAGAIGAAIPYVTVPSVGGNFLRDAFAGHFSTHTPQAGLTPRAGRAVKTTEDLEMLKQTAAA